MKKTLLLGILLIGMNLSLNAGPAEVIERSKGEVKRLKNACHKGVAKKCDVLGLMYKRGVGVQKSTTKSQAFYGRAAKIYSKACNTGDADACSSLAFKYNYYDEGVSQDFRKMAELFGKACDGGDTFGCDQAAEMYSSGTVIRQDYVMAIKFYGKACNGGNGAGCLHLGFIYHNVDKIKAKEFYGEACDKGNRKGCQEYKKIN